MAEVEGMHYEARTSSLENNSHLATDARLRILAAAEKEYKEDIGTLGATSGKDLLCRLLAARSGTVIRGWRQVLDPKDYGRVGFGDFAAVTRELGCKYPTQAAWKELGGDRGHLLLSDF